MIWYIRGSDRLAYMHDQFIQGPFRLTLRGTSLLVDIESANVTLDLCDRAKLFARNYLDFLGRILGENVWPLTEEEFSKLPPWAHQNQAMAGHHHRTHIPENAEQALRDARHSVISYQWPLGACYDYMQSARSSEERFLPEIYKMIETMENHLGGEAKLCARTGLTKEVKHLKRIANEGHRDERHAPEDQTPPQALTGTERTTAHDYATTVLRKFEEVCRSEGLAG
jgi:hypothetical protein